MHRFILGAISPGRLLAAAAVFAVAGFVSASPSYGAEPAREFLEALREQGLFDLARDYLERMEKSPLAPPEFRETVLFEQGLTLMAVSRKETSFDRRQELLDEAQQKFREFLTAHKNHDFAPKAKSQLANVLVERARVKVAEAERAKNKADKPALLQEASKFFEQALTEFKSSQEEIRKKLESLPKALDPERDAQRIEYRDELRKDYIEVQMVQAVILYEMSDTATETKEKNELLKRAAEKYGEIYEKYRRRLAGMYALLQQGKCYQEMGGKKNVTEALTYYQELLEQPEDPQPFRILRTKTLVQTLQCWLSDDIEEKKIDPAILKASEWISKMRPNETRDSDWLELHYELARAYQMKLAQIDEGASGQANIKREAQKLVDHGIKYSDDPLKTKFLELKAELGGKVDKPDEKPDPQTFAEAYAAGVEAWKAITNGTVQTKMLEERLAQTKDEEARQEIEKSLEESKQAMKEARGDAIEYFRTALLFVEPDTPLDELNLARFYLCSLHWSRKNYPEAAVYGEYLARYFPGHKTAKYGAIYARASYQNMYNEVRAEHEDLQTVIAAKPEDAEDLPQLQQQAEEFQQQMDFTADGVVRLSKLMIDKWEGDPEAEEALLVLIKFMVMQKDVEAAQKYLELVPLDSDKRGEAEITTGQAMWSTYLAEIKPARELEKQITQWQRDIKRWQDGEQPPEGGSIEAWQKKIDNARQRIATLEEQLEPLKLQAQQTLKDGIQRMRQSEVDKTLAAAVATLCRIYVEADQPQDAIELLEDPEIGALTLVEEDHPAIQREGVPAEIYTTALLAYFAALPNAANSQELFAKAEAAMDGLNNTVGQDKEGQQRLIGIYVTLAEDVKQMLERAPAAKRRTLTQVFATFLERVAETSEEFAVLRWVADNFYQLGETNDPGRGEPPANVKEYYAKAAEQYEKLLQQAQGDSSITSNMLIQLRVRLAHVLRRQGKFVLAMDQFEEVLKAPERNSMLDVQIDAAETYMEWADSEIGIDRLYLRAVNGGRKNSQGNNNVWGWVSIAKRLAAQIERKPETKDKFYETLHKAKINQARAHYKFAMSVEGDDREKYLKYAKQDIFLAAQSYPDLGGVQTRTEYDELLREVQSALKQKPVGLEEFKTEAVAAADTGDGGGGQ